MDRLRQSLLQPPLPAQQHQSKQHATTTPLPIDETKVVRTSLVLEPDVPLDVCLSVVVPTHELVEVGDMLYPLQLKLTMNMPDYGNQAAKAFPSSAKPYARPLCFNMLSGVTYMDSLGVVAADICEEARAPDYIVSSQSTTLPVPLQASVSTNN